MSDLQSTGTEKTGLPKKPTSPARNIIGLIVLVGVLAFGWFEYSAKSGFNRAVSALDARAQDEDKGLLTLKEAESLLGKEADGPGGDVMDGDYVFTKRTYTWPGLVRSYTLSAFFTKEKDTRLHHFETEGAKKEAEPRSEKIASPPQQSARSSPKGQTAKSDGKSKSSSTQPQPPIAPDSKTPLAGPGDQGSKDKPQPSVTPAPAGKPSAPGDKGSRDKPTASPLPAKP